MVGKICRQKYKNVFFDKNTNTIVFFGVLCCIFFARPDSSMSEYSSTTANENPGRNGGDVIMCHHRNAVLTKLMQFDLLMAHFPKITHFIQRVLGVKIKLYEMLFDVIQIKTQLYKVLFDCIQVEKHLYKMFFDLIQLKNKLYKMFFDLIQLKNLLYKMFFDLIQFENRLYSMFFNFIKMENRMYYMLLDFIHFDKMGVKDGFSCNHSTSKV